MDGILKKAHGKHEPHCPIGGFKGKDPCRHAANCCCEGGETMDEAAVLAKVLALQTELDMWLARLREPRKKPWFKR